MADTLNDRVPPPTAAHHVSSARAWQAVRESADTMTPDHARSRNFWICIGVPFRRSG